MLKITYELAGCENYSQTYLTEVAVYRVVSDEYSRVVQSILFQVQQSDINGIVNTKIIFDKATLDFFNVNEDAVLLEHKLVEFISYPHEWCSLMLKDAAIFHFDLVEKLSKIGLYLKDSHPWNILFECGKPVFIDFSSIVTKDLLFQEEFLLELVSKKDKSSIGGNNGSVSNIQAAILRAMFRPYFFAPLLGYAYGNRARVRSCIEITSLNAATSIISTRDILPSLRYCGVRAKLKAIKNLFLITFNIWRFNRIVLSINRGDSFTDNINNLLKLLGDIDTMNNESPYLAYYKNKNEDVSWAYSVQWNDKQKTVYQALNQQNISSVIDVACNTGWYAILAESLGKKVIAFDIDEACVDFLYKHVKKEGLNILPLVMDFTNLTKNRHSILDGKKILINAVDRFKSDSVIALGIIHHLFLGMGIGFDEIVMKLNSLSKRQMLIEYIHPSDLVIQEERSFFPAYLKNEKLIEAYNLNNLIIEIEKYGYIINVQKSYPQTRLILECTKFST